MHAGATERTAILVIRVWVEGDPPPRFRSRITRTLDVSQRNQLTTAAASTHEVEDVVRAWLEEFVAVTGVCALDPMRNDGRRQTARPLREEEEPRAEDD
jgi:hypothetical protein